tara:strand:- start:431 stop:832 length:402 start_codon:yes stop_codon:yes gene_type:complete
MKRLILLLAVSALTFMPAAGFSLERDLNPIEDAVLADIDYDLDVVVCSYEVMETSVDVVHNTKVSNLFEYRDGSLNLNEFGLSAKSFYIASVTEVDWFQKHLNKNTNGDTNYSKRSRNLEMTPGGANLKISLI